mgnify:FL=1
MKTEKPILKLDKVSKFYYNKGMVSSGFSKVSLEFFLGEFVVITGESGSGKSTLLNVLSGLDTYEEGEMYINGKETSHYSSEDIENYRKCYIGNIFQSFNLVSSYTVYQNIELVLLLNGFKKKDVKQKILDLIKKVDLYKYRNTKVSHLSGGQKQRVAIARALAKDVPIIIADEPTGNLDSRSSQSVIRILSEVAKDKLVIVVTHNYDEVEKYATRKIEMSDGKVREDISLKEYNKSTLTIHEYKGISFFNKIRLGVRNTFNIPMKFILLLIVFLLITLAFFGEYSSIRSSEYEANKLGYNYYFRDLSDERIVLKKKDNSYISDSDIEKLKKLEHVKKVNLNDIILDKEYYLTDNSNSYWFYGFFKEASDINEKIIGKMPENDNEVVMKIYKNNYYVTNSKEDILNTNYNLFSTSSKNASSCVENVKVTGLILTNSLSENETFYASDKLLNNIKTCANVDYSNIKMLLNNKEIYVVFRPNENVKPGNAYIPYQLNNYCNYGNCINNELSIKVKNQYYENSVKLNVSEVYTKNNFYGLVNIKDYDNNNFVIYISNDDYNSLFSKENYQVSVFVDDVKNIQSVKKYLDKSEYQALYIKDVKVSLNYGVSEVLKIFKVVAVAFLFIVLFFIAYFVIRIIEKSRNVYYATLRILGATKKVLKNMISIELFTVYHIAYILVISFIVLISKDIINSPTLSDMINYLTLKDYIIVYLVCFVMSLLISLRYSRKLFKSSAMKTYRDEEI